MLPIFPIVQVNSKVKTTHLTKSRHDLDNPGEILATDIYFSKSRINLDKVSLVIKCKRRLITLTKGVLENVGINNNFLLRLSTYSSPETDAETKTTK